IGPVIAHQVLQSLAAQHRVVFGAYLSTPPTGEGPVATDEWCDTEVLARIRRRSLAQLRAEVEPVDQSPMHATWCNNIRWFPHLKNVELTVQRWCWISSPGSRLRHKFGKPLFCPHAFPTTNRRCLISSYPPANL